MSESRTNRHAEEHRFKAAEEIMMVPQVRAHFLGANLDEDSRGCQDSSDQVPGASVYPRVRCGWRFLSTINHSLPETEVSEN